eukprot:TRINITY_DN4642_c0_g3_i3.p1 TRINITY_DN4642_c0_g3~~TRINITY_DN4642_c0_g3_i3.p1  ORF type:complete len:707 (+),score=156.58 TRINITY_DN4642_c0_g3_i3:50-2122(+)
MGVQSWAASDVRAWGDMLPLSADCRGFGARLNEAGIAGDQLPVVTDADLRELGVTRLSDRLCVRAAAAQLLAREPVNREQQQQQQRQQRQQQQQQQPVQPAEPTRPVKPKVQQVPKPPWTGKKGKRSRPAAASVKNRKALVVLNGPYGQVAAKDKGGVDTQQQQLKPCDDPQQVEDRSCRLRISSRAGLGKDLLDYHLSQRDLPSNLFEEGRVEELYEQLILAQQQKRKIEDTMHRLRQEISDTEQEFYAEQARIGALLGTCLSVHDQETEAQGRDLLAEHNQLKGLREALRVATDRLERVREEQDAIRRRSRAAYVSELEGRVKTYAAEVRQLRSTHARVWEERAGLELQQIDEVACALVRLNDEIAQLRVGCDEVNAVRDARAQQKAKYTEAASVERNRGHVASTRLRETRELLRDEAVSHSSELARLRKRVMEAEAERSLQEAELERRRREVSGETSELQAARAEFEAKLREAQRLAAERSAALGEHEQEERDEDGRSSEQQMEQNRALTTARAAALRDNAEALRTEEERLRSELSPVRSRVASVQQELAREQEVEQQLREVHRQELRALREQLDQEREEEQSALTKALSGGSSSPRQVPTSVWAAWQREDRDKIASLQKQNGELLAELERVRQHKSPPARNGDDQDTAERRDEGDTGSQVTHLTGGKEADAVSLCNVDEKTDVEDE